MNDRGWQTFVDVHQLGAALEALLAQPCVDIEPYANDLEAVRVALGRLLDKLRQEAA